MSGTRDIAAAFGWLSIVPVPAVAGTRPARWFPLVGWFFGVIAVALAWGAGAIGVGRLGSLLVGAIIVTAWAALSRLLHWDGIADTADGMLGGHTPERRLEIMHDSRTGAFGATAIVLGVLLETLAVGALVWSGELWPLMAAPVLGRFAASAGLWTLRPARAEGLAAGLAADEGVAAWGIALVTCALLLLAFSLSHVAIVAIGLTAGVLLPRTLARPIGGASGDILGASVILVEIVVLVACALLTGV